MVKVKPWGCGSWLEAWLRGWMLGAVAPPGFSSGVCRLGHTKEKPLKATGVASAPVQPQGCV